MSGARQLNAMVADIARRLAQNAEAVCQHYLFNGRRTGRYWHVGDVANTPGQSLYVRLSGPRAGKWIDAATGDHGDLLDLIALNRDLPSCRDALDEACRFLALPHEHRLEPQPLRTARDALEMPRRMFASGRPIAGTIAEAYLRNRGIGIAAQGLTALRFHPTCFYRANDAAPREARPALIAAVTDLKGRITGVERTWLDPSGSGKAAIPMPRRALGSLLGNGVRFGGAGKALLVGEGLETVLSLKSVMPTMPVVAALSASRLAGLALPSGLERLYVACDRDAAGWRALERISRLALAERFAVLPLRPAHGDFNDDLRANGPHALRSALRAQIARDDLALLALLE
jgi:hypothetical protein